jgi:protease-4
MKRIFLFFVALLAVAVLSLALGIALSRGGSGSALSSRPTLLVWQISGSLPDRATAGLPFSDAEPADSLEKLLPILAAARADRAVRGLAIELGAVDFGLARAQEVRRQILAFRKAKKIVECYSDSFGEGDNGTLPYYLASACDKIHLSPAGDLNLVGLYSERRYLKGSLDKLHISAQFQRAGKYKSAVETYTQERASPESREALGALLDSYYHQVVAAIAEGRARPAAEVNAAVDDAPYDAAEALSRQWVDQLSYPDQFRVQLAHRAGGHPRFLPIADYRAPSSFGARHRVAVVFAQGEIVRGHAGSSPFGDVAVIGAEDLAATLDELRDDSSCDAVVLRIDSPGGSALASDLILRAIVRLRQKKPLVASFSEIAASGGYYIAARADRIVAEAGTLTGSIGVFGGKFVTRQLEEDLLGIGHSTDKRGANADIYSSLDAWTPDQQAHLQRLLESVYRAFLQHVAGGRKMAVGAVEKIAGGRIWSGEAALSLGLVDEIGGLDEAIFAARRAAHIDARDEVAVDYFPRQRSWLDLLFRTRPPRLPTALARYAELLEPRTAHSLEIPPDLVRAARPF